MGNCWSNFWGPSYPLFGGHKLGETGSSNWVPTWLLIVTRVISAALALAIVILYCLLHGSALFLLYYEFWGKVLLSLSFTLLAASTIRLKNSKDPESSSLLASFATPLIQISASADFLVLISGLIVLGIPVTQLNIEWSWFVINGGSTALVLIDIILGTRIQARFSYMLIFVLLSCIYILATSLAWLGFFDPAIFIHWALVLLVGILVFAAYRTATVIDESRNKNSRQEVEDGPSP